VALNILVIVNVVNVRLNDTTSVGIALAANTILSKGAPVPLPLVYKRFTVIKGVFPVP
jgi:hypothetical protein